MFDDDISLTICLKVHKPRVRESARHGAGLLIMMNYDISSHLTPLTSHLTTLIIFLKVHQPRVREPARHGARTDGGEEDQRAGRRVEGCWKQSPEQERNA